MQAGIGPGSVINCESVGSHDLAADTIPGETRQQAQDVPFLIYTRDQEYRELEFLVKKNTTLSRVMKAHAENWSLSLRDHRCSGCSFI